MTGPCRCEEPVQHRCLYPEGALLENLRGPEYQPIMACCGSRVMVADGRAVKVVNLPADEFLRLYSVKA